MSKISNRKFASVNTDTNPLELDNSNLLSSTSANFDISERSRSFNSERRDLAEEYQNLYQKDGKKYTSTIPNCSIQNTLSFPEKTELYFKTYWGQSGGDILDSSKKVLFQIRREHGHVLHPYQRYTLTNKENGEILCYFQLKNQWLYFDKWLILIPVYHPEGSDMKDNLYQKIATVRSRTVKGTGTPKNRTENISTTNKAWLSWSETYLNHNKEVVSKKNHYSFTNEFSLSIEKDQDVLKMIAIAFCRTKIRNAQLGKKSLEPLTDRVVDLIYI